MGHQRHAVRLSVRWGGPGPSVVLAEGEHRLDPHAERGPDRLRFPWQLQFLLDAVPRAEIPRKLLPDGVEEVVAGPDGSGASR